MNTYTFIYTYIHVCIYMPTILQAPKIPWKKNGPSLSDNQKPHMESWGDGWMFVCQVPPLQWQQVMRFWRVNLDQQLDKSEIFGCFQKWGCFPQNGSGQIIATHPKRWFSKGNHLISGKSGLVKYCNLTRWMVYNGTPYLKWDDLGGTPHYFRKHPNSWKSFESKISMSYPLEV